MDKSHTALIITSAILITACTAPKYSSTPSKDTATISFASMSDEFPELSIKLRGKTFSIDDSVIHKRKPGRLVKRTLNIPAGEEISLTYETLDINNSYTPSIRFSVNPHMGFQPDYEEQHNTNNCTKNVSFTPNKNKNYEVFVKQADGKICQIYVGEVIRSPNEPHKTYNKINTKTPISQEQNNNFKTYLGKT